MSAQHNETAPRTWHIPQNSPLASPPRSSELILFSQSPQPPSPPPMPVPNLLLDRFVRPLLTVPTGIVRPDRLETTVQHEVTGFNSQKNLNGGANLEMQKRLKDQINKRIQEETVAVEVSQEGSVNGRHVDSNRTFSIRIRTDLH